MFGPSQNKLRLANFCLGKAHWCIPVPCTDGDMRTVFFTLWLEDNLAQQSPEIYARWRLPRESEALLEWWRYQPMLGRNQRLHIQGILRTSFATATYPQVAHLLGVTDTSRVRLTPLLAADARKGLAYCGKEDGRLPGSLPISGTNSIVHLFDHMNIEE